MKWFWPGKAFAFLQLNEEQRQCSLTISRIGGNVDQGTPLRPSKGAGTGARADYEKSRIWTVILAQLEEVDGGTGGTRGQ